jgi:hypothetical protein
MNLTQIEHASRLRISTRTFRRRVVEFGIQPADTNGNEPLYDVRAVDAMERERKAAALKSRYGVTTGILTVAQARRKAGAR